MTTAPFGKSSTKSNSKSNVSYTQFHTPASFVAFLSSSCKKDKDINLDNDDAIVGLRALADVSVDAYIDPFKIENIGISSSGTLELEPTFDG